MEDSELSVMIFGVSLMHEWFVGNWGFHGKVRKPFCRRHRVFVCIPVVSVTTLISLHMQYGKRTLIK